MAAQRGVFVSVEGMDLSGKSTLMTKLSQQLKKDGVYFRVIKMLGDGPIRESILWDESHSALQRALLYKVAAETARREIEKCLVTHDVVICERGPDTFYAYQGYGEKLLLEIKELDAMFPAFPDQDQTFYLDIPVNVIYERMKTRGTECDVFESRASDFFSSVQRGFRARAELHPKRFVNIDALQTADQVFEEVYGGIQKLLKNK